MIIPGFTYLATWQAVLWAGMVPVVADVDDNALLDLLAVEAALTPRTGAILAVHLTGAHAPTEALRVLADRQGAALVTDAAHALGSAAPARNADWLGDAGGDQHRGDQAGRGGRGWRHGGTGSGDGAGVPSLGAAGA